MICFGPEMNWDAASTGKRGRERTYSDTAMQTCLTTTRQGYARLMIRRWSEGAIRYGAKADDRVQRTPFAPDMPWL